MTIQRLKDMVGRLLALDPESLANILAAAALLVTVAFGLLSTIGICQQLAAAYGARRKRRMLERDFGADFYLPEVIERSTRYYLRPDCSSVDPAEEADLRGVVSSREDLFAVVDRFVEQESPHRHLLLLADSGMGKSSFVLNYYAKSRAAEPRKGRRIAALPLGHPSAFEYIRGLDSKRETVLLLDAFDEDPGASDDYRARLDQLMRACADFRRVLLTCRTQFFPRAVEIPQRSGFVYDPRDVGQPGVYEFRKLYLLPFTDQQVKAYIRSRFRWRPLLARRARRLASTVSDLAVRPMLLEHLPELVQAATIPATTYQLYAVLISQWLQRERHWIEPQTLDTFSEKLALNLHKERGRRGAEWAPREDIPRLARAWGLDVPPDKEWMLTGRSLLNRTAEGLYKFSHRSIMEYFLARAVKERRVHVRTIAPSDQVRAFLRDALEVDLCEKDAVDAWLTAYLFCDAVLERRELATLFSDRENGLADLKLDTNQGVFVATLLELVQHVPDDEQDATLAEVGRALDEIARSKLRTELTVPTARDLLSRWVLLAHIHRDFAVADAMRCVLDDYSLRVTAMSVRSISISDLTLGLSWRVPIEIEKAIRPSPWPAMELEELGGWELSLESAIVRELPRDPRPVEMVALWSCVESQKDRFNVVLGERTRLALQAAVRDACGQMSETGTADIKLVELPKIFTQGVVVGVIHRKWPELFDE